MTQIQMPARSKRRGLLFPVLLLLALPAVQGQAKKGGKVNEPLSLEFNLTRGERALTVHYTIHNRGSEQVYVLDQMVVSRGQSFQQAPKLMIVRQGAGPTGVELVRGYMDPGHPVAFPYAPAARPLPPGKSLEGTAELPLPLSAQHPYGRLVPLSGAPKTATLLIGYLGPGAEMTRYPTADGGSLTAPTLPATASQRFVTAGPKPIP